MNVNIRVDSSSYLNVMRTLPAGIKREVRRKLDRHVGRRLLRRIKARTRVRTGRLKRSAYKRPGAGRAMILELGYRAKYASHVEYSPINDRNIEKVVDSNMSFIQKSLDEAVQAAADRATKGRR